MFSFSINASASIQVSQPYITIEIRATLNRRLLKLSLCFGDFSIDLSFKNAAQTSPMRTLWQGTIICDDSRVEKT